MRPYDILIYYILLTILIQQFYNTVVIILNNVKPNGIPLHSEILHCMWYTLARMDLMMVREGLKHVVLLAYIRHSVIRTQHLLCLPVSK